MRSYLTACIVGLLVVLPVFAGDDGLTGTWKLSIYDGGRQVAFWLVAIQSKDGKIAVAVDALKGAPKVEIKDVKQAGDTFTVRFQATIQKEVVFFEYEGKLPKPGAKKILGSLSQGGSTVPAILEATNAKNSYDLEREFFLKTPTDMKAHTTILTLIEGATANKVDAKDLQDWVNTSLKSADLYGPAFLAQQQFRLLDTLQDQRAGYGPVLIDTASKIAKQIDPKAPPGAQLQTVTLAFDILRKSDKKDEAKTLESRIDKLEAVAYAEHAKDALNFKIDKAGVRKAKGNRAVLMELFTGAQCPPCVAADMAFDGLAKTYGRGEVILLQYHLHIPQPDPLANVDADARYEYYLDVKKARGTPSTLFNGKPAGVGGGFADDAPDKYKEYVDIVNKLLDSPDAVSLSASAVRTGDKISITAKVQELTSPGDKVRLRLVLVEDWARYRGKNQLEYHHRIVRAMPGGAKGFTLKAKESEHAAEVDLEKLKKSLNKYLDEDYQDGARPMRLRNLHVVAFVQNDDTNEVLHAIDVPVTDKK